MMRALRIVLVALAVALTVVAGGAPAPRAQEAALVDYAGWETVAVRAETALSEARASDKVFEQLRAEVAEWREQFTAAQNANSARIDTLRSQIAALGPAPADGESEAAQTATRRAELTEQLAQLQAPGVTAAEALSRAEGIIRQIDRLIRDREAQALQRLWPTPLNPLNWPAGSAVLVQGGRTLWAEVTEAWGDQARRAKLRQNLPLILVILAVAAVLVLRGPDFVERQAVRLSRATSLRVRHALAAFVSLGQVLVPIIGIVLIVSALIVSDMGGTRTNALLSALPTAAMSFFVARWLGSWIFPTRDEASDAGLDRVSLTNRPAEARFHTAMIGLALAVEQFRQAFITEVRPPLSMAAQSVWAAPLVLLVSLFLFRLGMLLRRSDPVRPELGEEIAFVQRLIKIVGTAVVVVGLAAPVLAAIGYVTAANALVWPMVTSLGLIGFLILLQRFVSDIYRILSPRDSDAREALIPVLSGFLLVFAALPFFALIWGARTTDLWEVWNTFRNGVMIGQTRISPTAFLAFVIIFVIGYLLTRLVQGALKTSILPRTRLEKGVQNAVSVGVGYVGIVLAAFVAINAAGIDLSSLAIVAGALSVGLGFGLQNIVQNFVSGIILLVERPVSEGDMIEVGGKMGIVRAISVRSTRIETFDRTELIVPNGDLITGVVTNWTRNNLTTRLIVPVGVAYGVDTRKVERILMEIAEDQPAVLVDPAPIVMFMGFGADSINFEIRAIVSDIAQKGEVQNEIFHRITERFAEEGVEIPFQQRDVWLRNPADIAAAFAQSQTGGGTGCDAPGDTAGDVGGRPVQPAADGAGRDAGPAPPPLPDPVAIRNDPDEGEDPDRR